MPVPYYCYAGEEKEREKKKNTIKERRTPSGTFAFGVTSVITRLVLAQWSNKNGSLSVAEAIRGFF